MGGPRIATSFANLCVLRAFALKLCQRGGAPVIGWPCGAPRNDTSYANLCVLRAFALRLCQRGVAGAAPSFFVLSSTVIAEPITLATSARFDGTISVLPVLARFANAPM